MVPKVERGVNMQEKEQTNIDAKKGKYVRQKTTRGAFTLAEVGSTAIRAYLVLVPRFKK